MNQSSSDPGFLLHISQLLVLEWIIQESYIIKMLAELSHLGSMFFFKWNNSPYFKNKCLCCTHVLLLGIFHYISYIILGNLSLVPQGAFSYQNIVMEYNHCIELIFLIKRKQETKHFLATYQ